MGILRKIINLLVEKDEKKTNNDCEKQQTEIEYQKGKIELAEIEYQNIFEDERKENKIRYQKALALEEEYSQIELDYQKKLYLSKFLLIITKIIDRAKKLEEQRKQTEIICQYKLEKPQQVEKKINEVLQHTHKKFNDNSYSYLKCNFQSRLDERKIDNLIIEQQPLYDSNIEVLELQESLLPELPDGWNWFSATEIEVIDNNEFYYCEAEEDAMDYICTYEKLYSRLLNGEYFYPDEEDDDMINIKNIENFEIEHQEMEMRLRRMAEESMLQMAVLDPWYFEDEDDFFI